MNEQSAFKKLKAAVTHAPFSALIDYSNKSKKMFLYTDALLVAFKGILTIKLAEV